MAERKYVLPERIRNAFLKYLSVKPLGEAMPFWNELQALKEIEEEQKGDDEV